MSTSLGSDSRGLARHRKSAILLVVGSLVGVALAYLIAIGLWPVALVLVSLYPGFILLHRRPWIVIPVWLFTGPLIAVTASPAVRAVFWVIHRALPLAALIAVLVSPIVTDRDRRLPRLGLPEVMMVGYVLVTGASILYRSLEPLAVSYLMYDRILAPMMLYVVIRLAEPGPREMRSLIPVFGFVLLFETLVGALSWVAPGALPGYWLNNQGVRTVGSLSEVNLYGTTVLTAGLFLFYWSMATRLGGRFLVGISFFGLALFMAFLTFSRASWLAALVVVIGLFLLRPKKMGVFLIVVLSVLSLLVASGTLDRQLQFADQRFFSEESTNSALSRLPVVVASVRMFNERPIIGWGYENFDRYDYQFHGSFANLIFPQEDHASHNLFLTILAEQGLLGFVLYMGPPLYWLVQTRRHYEKLPAEGYISRHLVVIGWLAILSHVVVNNFTRMQLPFGFGLYWIVLGIVASTIQRFREESADEEKQLAASI